MSSKSFRSLLLLGLVTLSIALSPALSRASALGAGQSSDSSVAGPIEISTEAEVVGSPFGAAIETTLFVENKGSEDAQIFLLGQFAWPDGSSNLVRYGRPVVLPANSALLMIALSVVPDSVGAGTGTFRAQAFVGAIGHGGRGDHRGALIARDESTFELE